MSRWLSVHGHYSVPLPRLRPCGIVTLVSLKFVKFLHMLVPMQVEDLSSVLPVDEVSSALLLDAPNLSPKKVAFAADSRFSLSDFVSICGHHSVIRVRQLTSPEAVSLGKGAGQGHRICVRFVWTGG